MTKVNWKKTLILSFFLLLMANSASAGQILGNLSDGCIDTEECIEACVDQGEEKPVCIKQCGCTLNDIVLVAVNVSQFLLTISGSIALLFFVYGGVTFLLSGGSSDKVSKGKQIIVNAIIGLIIIFTSFVIIDFSMTALGYNQDSVFRPWSQSL